jgi:hypothetical protein
MRLLMGYGFVIGFIGVLEIETTSNYNRFTNLHTPQFTTAPTKSSQSAVPSPAVRQWLLI